MANTIDIKGAIINITPSKTVKFQNMSSAGSSGGGNKSSSFLDKGEYKNLGKFVVLTGQSLKKMNVNLLQTKKILQSMQSANKESSKDTSDKLGQIATAIGAQKKALNKFAKQQKESNKTLKDLAGKVGTSLELDKIRNKGALEDRRERRREKAERTRREREDRLEKVRGAVGKVGGLAKGAIGKGKGFLDTLMSFLGIGSFIASVATAFVAYPALKGALNSNFVKNTVKGFFEGLSAIVTAIQSIPQAAWDNIGKAIGGIVKFFGERIADTVTGISDFISKIKPETLDKFGKFFGKVFKFLGNFIGDRFKDVFNGLDKIVDENGNLKFDLGGIFQLIGGIGGLALTYRYLKNPTKIIDDVGSVFGFFGKLTGAIPGGGKIQQMLGMTPGGRKGKDLGTRGNPMHVYVVNQGGGGGGGLDDLFGPKGPGLRPRGRFTAPRGGGLNRGGSRLARFMRTADGLGMARPGSIINEATGAATRMLGGNKMSTVASQLRQAGASKGLRAAVLSGRMTQQQAMQIAAKGGPGWLQTGRGLLAQGANLGRGLWAGAKGLGQNLLAGAMALPGNAMNLAKNVGGRFTDLGGKAVGGIRGSLTSLGKGLQNLNPMQALEQIRGGVSTKIDEIMKAEPLIKTIKNLKDPKKIKSLLSTVGSKAKPALNAVKDARKALGPFKIPGVDVLIGTLGAVAEIAMGGSAGNAILGALGGVLGSAAGTAVGTPGGPPGMFIGALAGGVLGEFAGRALARTLAGILPPGVANYTGLNGSPLFNSGADPAAVKKARGGQIFGGRPTGDSVPAYLERGEYVLNRKAVSAIGPQRLNAINFGAYPRFQEGGRVNFGASIAKKLMQDFQGMSAAAAAGIAGNMDHESNGFIPDIREGGPYGGGSKPWPPGSHKGYGWAQWTGSRHDDFVNRFIGSFDKRATNENNYSMLAYEMKKPGGGFIGQTLAGYKAHTSPAAAAVDFRKTWERAGVAHDARRISAANKIAPLIGGAADLDWSASSPSGGATSSTNNKGNSGGWLGKIFGFMQQGGIVNPTPKTNISQNKGGYAADTGLDIIGKVGDPIVSPVDGTLEYLERGHTAQMGQDSDPTKPGVQDQHSFRIKVDKPFEYAGKKVNFVYGTHLSAMNKQFANKSGVKVKAGDVMGAMGVANNVPHLHVGFVGDRAQRSYLKFNEVKGLLTGAKNVTPTDASLVGGTNDGSSSGATASANDFGLLSAQDLLAKGGIAGEANVKALSDAIMKIKANTIKAGGGNLFGGSTTAVPTAPSANQTSPVGTPSTPSSGGDSMTLSSTSQLNQVMELLSGAGNR